MGEGEYVHIYDLPNSSSTRARGKRRRFGAIAAARHSQSARVHTVFFHFFLFQKSQGEREWLNLEKNKKDKKTKIILKKSV